MPDIDRILRAVEAKRLALPLSANAYDMFMRGHLTTEQYQQVSAGEEMRTMQEEKKRSKSSILRTPDGEHLEEFHLPDAVEDQLKRTYNRLADVDLTAVTKRCAETIDNVLAAMIPNQIDHVIIIAKRENKVELSMANPRYKVQLKLLDIKKQTSQIIGTDIHIPYAYYTATDDTLFWHHFEESMQRQFQTVVLQLITAIKTDAVNKIGR